jgi:hypothetical protein
MSVEALHTTISAILEAIRFMFRVSYVRIAGMINDDIRLSFPDRLRIYRNSGFVRLDFSEAMPIRSSIYFTM